MAFKPSKNGIMKTSCSYICSVDFNMDLYYNILDKKDLTVWYNPVGSLGDQDFEENMNIQMSEYVSKILRGYIYTSTKGSQNNFLDFMEDVADAYIEASGGDIELITKSEDIARRKAMLEADKEEEAK